MQKRSRDKANRFSPYGGAQPSPAELQQAAATAAYYGMVMQQPGMMPGMQQPLMQPYAAQSQDEREELKVSQTSVAKSVAGKIAADARNGVFTPVVARGTAAVNTATKAIAMAGSFLVESGISLSVSPYHKNDGDQTTGRSVVFFIKKRSVGEVPPPTTVLKVTKKSEASKVAGSIAQKTRKGEVIAMQGIGPDAVNIGVDAFVAARRFLKVDSALDITFTPQFVTVPLGDKTASAMYFTIEQYTRK